MGLYFLDTQYLSVQEVLTPVFYRNFILGLAETSEIYLATLPYFRRYATKDPNPRVFVKPDSTSLDPSSDQLGSAR